MDLERLAGERAAHALVAGGFESLSEQAQGYLAHRLAFPSGNPRGETRNLGRLKDLGFAARGSLARFGSTEEAARELVRVSYRAAPRDWSSLGAREMAALNRYPDVGAVDSPNTREGMRKLTADWEAFDRLGVGSAVLPELAGEARFWRVTREDWNSGALSIEGADLEGRISTLAEHAGRVREALRRARVNEMTRFGVGEVVEKSELRRKIEKAVPNAITCLGHGLTIWWILGGHWAAGVVGLLCDDLDGIVARKLGATSDFGGTYDWAVDITLCSVMLGQLGILPAAALLVPLQVYRHVNGPPVGVLQSSRAVLTAAFGGARAWTAWKARTL